MSFKNQFGTKESIELVSLIDMIFILLIFFLVSSYVIQTPSQEKGIFLPSPKNEPGEAQILIQIIDSNNVFWLDESSYQTIHNLRIVNGLSTAAIIRHLRNTNTYSLLQFNRKISYFKKSVQQNPDKKYFILIRCPNNLPYYLVMNIISDLAVQSNIEYGCVGGTFQDILNCNNIIIDSQHQKIKIDL